MGGYVLKMYTMTIAIPKVKDSEGRIGSLLLCDKSGNIWFKNGDTMYLENIISIEINTNEKCIIHWEDSKKELEILETEIDDEY